MDLSLPKATILVVDDLPANLRLLSEILQMESYRVQAFLHGRQALAAAARHTPDLVLLDINMPEMNGFEVCAQLKTDPRLREIPVLFISALAETDDKMRAFTAGGVDYLTKPFQAAEVLARVKTHLNLRRLQVELNLKNHHLEELVKEKVEEITESQMAMITALAKLAESRDDDTGTHIERTQIYCKLLAKRLSETPRYANRINQEFIDAIYFSAALHDIGKVGIPDHILLKRGPLSSEEYAIMQSHTIIGENTLLSARQKYPRNMLVNMGIAIVSAHHEKWDGTGYPNGLAGEEIPLSARILAVADVYDALSSSRPYKLALSHEESVRIIQQDSGKHFDPSVVAAFLDIQTDLADIRSRLDKGLAETTSLIKTSPE